MRRTRLIGEPQNQDVAAFSVGDRPGEEPDARVGQAPMVGSLFFAGLVLLLVGFAAAVFFRRSFDYPVMLFLNGLGGGSGVVDKLLLAPGRFDLLGGPIFVAGVWLVWFDSSRPESRLRIVSGVVGASLGGALSRGMQLTLPTHPRPIHDQALAFVRPTWIDPDVLNHWNSFPSDHAALFFGLAAVMFFTRPRLGAAALVWALVVDLNRVCDGIHFLSDVIGGAGLGITLVCVFQHPRVSAAFTFVLGWVRRRPAVFYASAFVVTYEIANLFDDIRDFGHALGHLLRS